MYRSDTMLQKKEIFNLYSLAQCFKFIVLLYIHREGVLESYGFLPQTGLIQLWNKSITKLSPINSQLNQCTANANMLCVLSSVNIISGK